MNYEVREILKGSRGHRRLEAYGVYPFDAPKNAKPAHTFQVSDEADGPRVAHYLACQMVNDLNSGVE
jgi:hypothetical protein